MTVIIGIQEKQDNHIIKLALANKNSLKLLNIAEYKEDEFEEVQEQYTSEHSVLYFKINSMYQLDELPSIVQSYFEQILGIQLSDANNFNVQDTLERLAVQELTDSVWNNTDIPWIRKWVDKEDIQKAKTTSRGSLNKITITCPECGRKWEAIAHNLRQKFRGCTIKAGGCGCITGLDEQLKYSSEQFAKMNKARREIV